MNPRIIVINDIWTFSNVKNLLFKNEKANKAEHTDSKVIFDDVKDFKKFDFK